MPELPDLLPEQWAGLGGAALPLAVMASQGMSPDLREAKELKARALARKIRTGDILLTRSKHPASGFRLFTTALTGEPVYHAEYLLKRPGRGVETVMAGTGSPQPLRKALSGESDLAVLLRPKDAAGASKKKLIQEALKLTKTPYSDVKVPMVGLSQLLMPQSRLLGMLPATCVGEVCSTGPATIMRRAGIDPKLSVIPGTELAGDYLRSPHYEVQGRWGARGVKPPALYRLTTALPARLGLGAGLGLGAYKIVKDVREGKSHGPLGALAGGLGGGVAGITYENIAANAFADPEGMKAYMAQKIGKVAPPHHARNIAGKLTQFLKTMHVKYALLPAAALTALGGAGGYFAARKAFDKD